MSRRTVIGGVALLTIVLLAGCSGILSGQDAGAATPTPTPGQDQAATPAATPTPTATPTATATPTPTPTPVPDYLDYERFGAEIAQELNKYRGDEEWVVGFGDHEEDVVGVRVTKPEGWTVQDAEMEGAREIARLSAGVARDSKQEAKEIGGFVRPDQFQVLVVNENGTRLSLVTINGDAAAAYANHDLTVEEYASQVARSRGIYDEAPSDVTISKREPRLALLNAEYRPFKQIHLDRIDNSNPFGLDEVNPEIDKVVLVPEEETIYYEYTTSPEDNVPAQESQVSRTYLETIKEVTERRRVTRLPEQMVLYQDHSEVDTEYGDYSAVTTAKTEWALEYFALSDWTLPQNKTMTRAELDAYYNRIAENKKTIENDEDYDALNQTVRDSD